PLERGVKLKYGFQYELSGEQRLAIKYEFGWYPTRTVVCVDVGCIGETVTVVKPHQLDNGEWILPGEWDYFPPRTPAFADNLRQGPNKRVFRMELVDLFRIVESEQFRKFCRGLESAKKSQKPTKEGLAKK